MDNRSVKALRRVDLARATGCNLETIRYYETVGIMPDPPRTAKGYRCYDDIHVRRLKFVMRSRDLGFSLEEIRGLLGLVDDRAQTCAQVDRHGRAVVFDEYVVDEGGVTGATGGVDGHSA